VLIGRDEARCTGCKTCQLVCSLRHFKEHNPKKSAIGIRGEFPAPGRYRISLCTQCEKCIRVCPEDAISNQDGIIRIDADKCTYCLACVEACPFGAIFTHRDFSVPFICDVCGDCVDICPTKALYWKD
jgi:Fe-S-cluster-containing hydrogenase component 2